MYEYSNCLIDKSRCKQERDYFDMLSKKLFSLVKLHFDQNLFHDSGTLESLGN